MLSRAKSLIVAVKAPLAEVKSTQEKVLEQNADYLSRGALKQLEDRNKRELNARERSGIMEALASARTLMRDVLLLGLAINLLGLRQERLRVANMLPGVFLPVAYIPLYNWIGGLIG